MTLTKTIRYGLARHIYYMGKEAAVLVCCGTDDDKTFYLVTSKYLAEDIYNEQTSYDLDVLKRGLEEGWLKIYIKPEIFIDDSMKDKITLGIKILKSSESRPDGFFNCRIIPARSG